MMKAHQPGSYLGVRFSPKTIEMVEKFCEANDIPNAVPAGELHTTLIYSEKHLPDIESESGPTGLIEGMPTLLK